MKMYSKLVLLVGLGLGATAFAEGADDKPVKPKKPKMTAEEKFAKLDKNGDGVLSFEEWSYKPVKADKIKKDDKNTEKDVDGDN